MPSTLDMAAAFLKAELHARLESDKPAERRCKRQRAALLLFSEGDHGR